MRLFYPFAGLPKIAYFGEILFSYVIVGKISFRG
jgi:hypothetical protein